MQEKLCLRWEKGWSLWTNRVDNSVNIGETESNIFPVQFSSQYQLMLKFSPMYPTKSIKESDKRE